MKAYEYELAIEKQKNEVARFIVHLEDGLNVWVRCELQGKAGLLFIACPAMSSDMSRKARLQSDNVPRHRFHHHPTRTSIMQLQTKLEVGAGAYAMSESAELYQTTQRVAPMKH
jgi:hypothetical protein